ncbi:EscU/YscU/HrcU family type III secretion system export apparatus switch protein [Cohnella sp. LGH]|uniref:Flagellar biosynthesis protein n=1 Tax=Cohnella phaseoli TaxID=456490 RepID=A0A3D9KLC5_9BACL|nr:MULTISPECIES: EscU/YscU/HrcU family type III secretion system export apparatus switch protein [Cohnella]QTH45929.1 EscU/YscU/HrcU family type III secretion system export apparatus switch protein [Cohnella sp. LGH]RED86373.1 flagellar biosynthesis protein [Cohnella phaseoli]
MNEAGPDNKKYIPKKAVALKYEPEKSSAPVVIAKGQGVIAEEIMRRAQEHGVPLQEDSSLVEVLSKLDLNQEIPPELYRLVAEVLSFVYRSDRRAGLKAKGGGEGGS